jgi:predicted acetyltransferase
MLAQALVMANNLGIEKALLTVAPDNIASQLVIQRNGGIAAGVNHEGEMRYWIEAPSKRQACSSESARELFAERSC